ncbi:DUF3788 family protein [Enterococcus sp. CSURQ0835]|uniref:DUF3788 family protein n=1 Tax=Enterococcus sp. CSURQ0835 TaxID=2681394 RepID=UPI0013570D53|nr:DUF3788 family protein [Enterococcus sp. CSURQ0835]
MENKWQTTRLKSEKPDLQQIMAFLPNPKYLKIMLAQLDRHYEPAIKIIFRKQVGWYIKIEQFGGTLGFVIIHDDYFSVVVPLPDFADDYLRPMLPVMSAEFKQKYRQLTAQTHQLELKVSSEEEMEDVIYLVSLQAKKLRENR